MDDEDLKSIIIGSLRETMRWYNLHSLTDAWEFRQALASEAESYLERPYKNLSITFNDDKTFSIDGRYEPKTLDRELIEKGYTQEDIIRRLSIINMLSIFKGKWNYYGRDSKEIYTRYEEEMIKGHETSMREVVRKYKEEMVKGLNNG